MSLKGFHILFIAFAFLCTAGFCAWTWLDAEAAQKTGAQTLGNLSGVFALGLLVYELWFVFKKAPTITT